MVETEPAGSHRRRTLAAAAYKRIAEGGFEGLRTRDVAGDVGVNIATLHYYYPTKEALIRGAVGQAMEAFGATLPREGSPGEQLRRHMAALRQLLKDDRDLCAVMGELSMRAARDQTIAELMRDLDHNWHRQLRRLLLRAIEEGTLDASSDADGIAAALISAIKGVIVPTTATSQPERVDQTFAQLERWLGLAT
jgi:AcrR family transcriptional regulator